MKPLTLILFGGGLAVASPVLAEDPPATPGPDLVVTATRLPTPLDLEPTSAVVTGQQIEARQSASGFDLLSTIPGVETSRSGAFGGVASIRIRGATADKTLVLIDGAPVDDPSQPAGGYDASGLNAFDIARIEVLEGPQGSIWGSDAIGGVVSITTREPDGVRALIEGGSFGTARAGLSVGIANDRRAFGLSAAYDDSDGISKADSRDGNDERDGYDNLTLGANARASIGDRVIVDGKVRWRRSHTDTDSFGGPTGVIDGPDTSKFEGADGFVRARIKDVVGFDQELRVDASKLERSDSSFFDGALYAYPATGDRIDYRWTAQRSGWGPHAILVGAEHEADHENAGDGRYGDSNTAVFGIWRFTPVQWLSTTASLRHDQPSGYGGVTTARAAATAGLGDGFSLSGSWGQGFKAPSLYQRTYPCFECVPAGPATDLKPEQAEGFDMTLAWRSPGGATRIQATVYRLNVHDQIDYEYPQGYLNIDRARTNGVQARIEQGIGHGLSLQASYDWADAIDASTGARLLRVPEHTASGSLFWRSARADAALTVRGQSRAADVYGDIEPFVTADLAGSYALTPRLRVTARIENLTDTHYQEAFGYGEPGIAGYFGFRLEE